MKSNISGYYAVAMFLLIGLCLASAGCTGNPASNLTENEPMSGIRYFLNEIDSGRTITLQKGDSLDITLPTTPGLAYRWIMPVTGSGPELMNASTTTEIPNNANWSNGSPFFPSGKYRFCYRAVSTGTSVFEGVFSHNVCDTEYSRRFNLTVNIV
ncbi:hypothetical protein MKMG_00665 [Methanogenium sp. MK-MG]|nr:hypothetical protein MKMG_00665 [Methanogenium sp. MK-MG]